MTVKADKQTLLTRRDELRARLDKIKQDYGRGLDANLEEQAIELENAEVLAGIADAAAAELATVERQLAEFEGHRHAGTKD